ncbi:MAG: Gfo/Idh/MocA family protein [Bdellovibrionota bacterium]
MSGLRAALIGCGRIGAFTRPELRAFAPKGHLPLSHAEAILANENIRLVALCDTDGNNLAKAAQIYGVKDCFKDYKELILETKPDIISIATRTLGRCDIIEFAVENGVRGIHLEKPISTNMADCRRALGAVRKSRAHLTYGTTRRFMDAYRQAKELSHSGEIGDLVEISVEMGKAQLLWTHPHSIDLILFFAGSGEVESVQGSCKINASAIDSPMLIDDDPVVENAFIKFKNNVTGLITSRSGKNVTLCGTAGNIIVAADGSWIEIQRRGATGPYFSAVEKIEVDPKMSGTQRAFCELAAAILGGQPPSINADVVELSQEVLLSIALSSIQNGRRVGLSELPEAFTVTGRTGNLFA